MRKMRKVLALLSVMAIAAGLFAGCNNDGGKTESKTEGTSQAASQASEESKKDDEASSKTSDTDTEKSADESKEGSAEESQESTAPSGVIASEDDLKDKKIGVQNGTTGAIISEDYIDSAAGGEIQYFSTGSEAVLALTQGKVDCVIIDEQPAKAFVSMNEGLKIIDKELTDEDYAAVIAKTQPELLDQVNNALKELKEDGTLDKIVKSYIPEEGNEGGDYHYTATNTEGEKLVMATSADFPPYEFYEGSDIVGIDVEIATAVADKIGRVLEVQDMKFDAIIPAVDSGKADIGFSGFTVTDERKLMINFTDTYAHSKQVMIVKE